MSAPVNAVLIGAGMIASAYIDASLAEGSPLRFVAVVETDAVRAHEAAQRLAVPAFAELDAFLSSPLATQAQAALVCSPPSTHGALTMAALNAGLAVLCEKPLAPDRAGLHQMIDTSRRSGSLLMMASKFRYVDDVTHAREILAAGELGEPVLFRNAFTSRVDMAGRWNSVSAVSGGGVIIDNGTHSVDIARYLLGPIGEVVAAVASRIQPIEVEDTAQLMVRTVGGVTGTIDLSWSLHSGSEWYVIVDGTEATLRLGWKRAEINRGSGWEQIGSGYDKRQAFAANLADFASALTNGSAPRITLDDMIASVAVIDAAYESLRTSTWVTVVEERRSVTRT